MSIKKWLNGFLSYPASSKTPSCRRRNRRTRLIAEALEDRTAPAIFTVLNTAGEGAGSLAQAIIDANDAGNSDTDGDGEIDAHRIQFDIPADEPGHVYFRDDGVAGQVSRDMIATTTEANDADIADIDPDWPHSWFSIQPADVLPAITEAVTIDGYTQAGASENTNTVESREGLNSVLRIEIDGSGAPGGFGREPGLRVEDPIGTTVRGLVVHGFPSEALIRLQGEGSHSVAGNLLGTDVSGTVGLHRQGSGVRVNDSANHRIGGTDPAHRNLISGNSTGIRITGGTGGNLVQGNLIGTDRTGAAPVQNHQGLRVTVSDNVIGGTEPGAGNLISGNRFGLIARGSESTGNAIQGNLIGTDVTGTMALGNDDAAIRIDQGASETLIGGTTVTARNVVSGNNSPSTIVSSSDNNQIQGNYLGTDITGTVALGGGHITLQVGTGNLIGGTSPGAGNVISGNNNRPINIDKAQDTRIHGNLIGTDATGTVPLDNDDEVLIDNSSGTIIGGTETGAGNVIANTFSRGLWINRSDGTVVQGNFIGTDRTATLNMGVRLHGIEVGSASTDTTIGGSEPGAGNTIAFSERQGIRISGGSITGPITGTTIEGNTIFGNGRPADSRGQGIRVVKATGVSILSNAIFDNEELGIDLQNTNIIGVTPNDPGDTDSGEANNLQNFPVLDSVLATATQTRVDGTLNSLADTSFRVDFFSSSEADPSGFGEGEVFLGSTNVTTDADGNALISVVLDAAAMTGGVVTATATRLDADGNPVETSEFSEAIGVAAADDPVADFTVSPDDPKLTEEVTFDASSSVDPDGSVVEYHWDFDNDGTIDTVTTDPVTTHTYSATVDVFVTLTVQDDDGFTDSLTRALSDGGPIVRNSSTPGTVGTTGEVDDWTFFGRTGRAVTVSMNPGPNGAPPAIELADVRLLDTNGNVLATGSSAGAEDVLILPGVELPADGIYHVEVGAASGHPDQTGNYTLTVWNATVDEFPLVPNQRTTGLLESPYAVDRWTFSARANEQVRFDLIARESEAIRFRLTGPEDGIIFDDVTADTGLITLPADGKYVLEAFGDGTGKGSYAFQLEQLTATLLTLGTPHTGALVGNDDAQLFRVKIPVATVLQITLDDLTDTGHNDVYVGFAEPPTRADFDSRSTTPASADQELSVSAFPGTWYVLLYGDHVPSAADYSLTIEASDVVLTNAIPDRHSGSADALLTLTGVGFDQSTGVELIADDGTVFTAASVTFDTPTQVMGVITAGSVPGGIYDVRATSPGGDTSTLSNAFEVLETSEGPQLEVELITPEFVRRDGTAAFTVEYTNTGDVAMPAVPLTMEATDRAKLVYDGTDLVQQFFTSADVAPDTVQFLAQGRTVGRLEPGESHRVTIAYAGLSQPWDLSDDSITVRVGSVSGGTIALPFVVKELLRPPAIEPDAWDIIYANVQQLTGITSEDYAGAIAGTAQHLGRLGRHVTDSSKLWGLQVMQAAGFGMGDGMAAAVDLHVDAPGLPLMWGRTFAGSLAGRHEMGPLGHGWAVTGGWNRHLRVDLDGRVLIDGSGGALRRFLPDSRGGYFSSTGDHATLTEDGAGFLLEEPNGLRTRFRADGQVDFLEEPNGNRITGTYDGDRLTRLAHSSGGFIDIEYNGNGRIARVTDSHGDTVQYEYDLSGEHLTAVTGTDGETTTYIYNTATDSAKRHALLEIVRPGGTEEVFTYDELGRLASAAGKDGAERVTFSYDTGRISMTDLADGTSEIFFDENGLIAKQVDPLGRTSFFTYDDALNLTEIIDPAGQPVDFEYDDAGNLVLLTDRLGNETRFAYNGPFNRLTAVIDARGNPLRYSYDAKGNLISTTYADGSMEEFAYDAVGNLTSSTNRREQSIDYAYDSAGRLTSKALPDGSNVTYEYDDHGNLTKAKDTAGDILMSYDEDDRLQRIDYPTGRFLEFTYDAAGRRTQMADQDGFTVNYSYVLGRLAELMDGSGEMIVSYTYDDVGRLAREDKGNDTFTLYDYDAAGQVLSVTNRAPDSSVNSRFEYTYDELGRRTSMETLDGLWEYEYDPTGQLTRATFDSNDPGKIPDQDLEYVYDEVGNRIRTVINSETTEYQTNDVNQYVQVGDATYAFDLDGNLIERTDADGSTTQYTYDAENRLVGVTSPDGEWSYVYNPFGHRRATIEDGERTEYLVDPNGPLIARTRPSVFSSIYQPLEDVVGEYAPSGSNVNYTHGLGLTTRIAGGERFFYDFDALGSTIGISNAVGDIINEYAYSPFSQSLVSSEQFPNPFEFVGAPGIMHEDNGLHFMRARFYDNALGRFMGTDPVGIFAGDPNLYRYVANNSLSNLDPTGTVLPCALLTGAAGTLRADYWVQRAAQLRTTVTFAQGSAWQWSETIRVGASALWGSGALWGGTTVGAGGALTAWAGVGGAALAGVTAGCFVNELSEYLYGESGAFGSRLADLLDPNPDILVLDENFVRIRDSFDPNQKLGPAGFGPDGFVAEETLFPYRVDFENHPEATAPAHRVVITDELHENLDPSTLEFTEVGFGDTLISVPDDTQHFETTVSMTQNGETFDVEITLDLDLAEEQITAVFQSVDPDTSLPPSGLAGFLPPEDGTGRGQGHISFLVEPDEGLPTGAEISNVALITFDSNEPVATNQVDPLDPSQGTDPAKEARNTIDGGAPSSQVQSLLPTVTPTFEVTWTGSDDAGGSGVGTFDVYVSEDGGPFALWLDDVTQTSADYPGTFGSTYAFYSVATDNVGHQEAAPAKADAVVEIALRSDLPDLFVDSRGLYEDFFGGNEKWLRGDVNQFGNPWYYILPSGEIFAWDGSSGLSGASLGSLGSNGWENPQLLVNATPHVPANPSELEAADEARAFYRSSTGNFYFDAFGGREKWIKGKISAKSTDNQNNPWYFILPDGSVHEWDGTAGSLTGSEVTSITPDITIYEDPFLLFKALQDPTVNSGGFDQQRHFFFDNNQTSARKAVRDLWENWSDESDEKWFRGDEHQFDNPWYFVLPNGALYEWDGDRSATGNKLADLGPNAWNNIERVVADFEPTLDETETDNLVELDREHGLFRATGDRDFFFDFFGRQEKWLRGSNNTFDNPWYIILPNSTLLAWDGSDNATGNELATELPQPVYNNPLLIADAFADGSVLNDMELFNPFHPNKGSPGDQLGG